MPPKNNPGHGGVPKKKRSDADSEADSKNEEQGTFDTFFAEASTFHRSEQHKKAVASYTKALELQPDNQGCLVARSKCYLELGNFDAAQEDAETTLAKEPNNIQGLYQKAEALYRQGAFEFALVHYHRGKALRQEKQEFRLGIQKAQEAIINCIGEEAGVHLKNEGDLSYFHKQEEKKQKTGGYSKPMAKKDTKTEEKRQITSAKDSKTMKQLLGELYDDREYLEKLLKDKDLCQSRSDTSKEIRGLAYDGVIYLDTCSNFWQQQKPMYSRKHDKQMRNRHARRDKVDPTNYVLKNLEEIDIAQSEGRHKDSLRQARQTLKEVRGWSNDDVPNRHEVIANLHSCIGNAHLEMDNYDKALHHHEQELDIANRHDIAAAKARALDNIGRVYARQGKFKNAIEVWNEKLPLSESALEKTWLYHEIGRCYLELGQFQEAKDHGEKSYSFAMQEESDDHDSLLNAQIWQLNASVLIAQSEVKLENYQDALDGFEKALELAKIQDDEPAKAAIQKAIENVNQKIVNQIKEGEQEKGSDKERPASAKSNKSNKSNHSQKSGDGKEEVKD